MINLLRSIRSKHKWIVSFTFLGWIEDNIHAVAVGSRMMMARLTILCCWTSIFSIALGHSSVAVQCRVRFWSIVMWYSLGTGLMCWTMQGMLPLDKTGVSLRVAWTPFFPNHALYWNKFYWYVYKYSLLYIVCMLMVEEIERTVPLKVNNSALDAHLHMIIATDSWNHESTWKLAWFGTF